MATTESMKQCAKVVELRGANIVLVSATAGTTNLLVELTEYAKCGDFDNATKILAEISDRHTGMMTDIGAPDEQILELRNLLKELHTLVKGCTLIKACSPQASDAILSIGEMLSSTIFAVICEQTFSRSVYWLNARDFMKTDSQHGKATPDIDAIHSACKTLFVEHQELYISQGFMGCSPEGVTTTLGRGGSDYSAALVAEGIRADELQIWTDVPGMASSDPRVCSNAKSISAISIKEASEMATFGAKILHPSSLMPAVRHSIPVFVGSTFQPELPGTTITPEVTERPVVRAVTSRSNQWLVVIRNPDMLTASGFLEKIFAVFEHYDISVDAITTSEVSIAVTIDASEYPDGDFGDEFLAALQALGTVRIEKDMALVAIVGNHLHCTPGIGSRIFDAIKDINVRMVTQGASTHNFCLIVADSDVISAVQSLHQKLIIDAIE